MVQEKDTLTKELAEAKKQIEALQAKVSGQARLFPALGTPLPAFGCMGNSTFNFGLWRASENKMGNLRPPHPVLSSDPRARSFNDAGDRARGCQGVGCNSPSPTSPRSPPVRDGWITISCVHLWAFSFYLALVEGCPDGLGI